MLHAAEWRGRRLAARLWRLWGGDRAARPGAAANSVAITPGMTMAEIERLAIETRVAGDSRESS